MAQWYFHIPGRSDRVGPLDEAAARQYVQANPGVVAWREGLQGWQPAASLSELADGAAAFAPPPLPGGARADDIDFRIIGNDMQFVEVELDPGESAIAEAGALMYKDASVQMDTVFGDGSASGQSGGGLMGKLLSAGKRVVTGESLFTTVYTHTGAGKAKVAFAAPYPGTVLAMKLSDHGGRLICRKTASWPARAGCRWASRSSARSSPACSAARASSCRSSKATAGCSCMPAAPWWNASWLPGSASMSTPAASWPTTPRWTWTCAGWLA